MPILKVLTLRILFQILNSLLCFEEPILLSSYRHPPNRWALYMTQRKQEDVIQMVIELLSFSVVLRKKASFPNCTPDLQWKEHEALNVEQ